MTGKSEDPDRSAPLRLIETAIEPRSKVDREELAAALVKLAADDTSLQVATDPQSGRIILKGMDESHLDACIDRLWRACGGDINVGAPQVAFRERPTRRAEVEYVHKKQSGRSGQFAAVKIAVEPNKPGAGYVFESMIIGSAVPEEYIPGVERGLASVLASGVVAAFPVIDVKVVLLDGKYHDVDSSARAFEIASRTAFREALQKAGSLLFEPIMTVEVVTAEDCAGPIIGNLNSRRGQVLGRRLRGDASAIRAMVPLTNMFGYADTLWVVSRGARRLQCNSIAMLRCRRPTTIRPSGRRSACMAEIGVWLGLGMVASDSFAEFLREQLAPLGPITLRRMFGKTGVFCGTLMFGMVTENTLYFRVDDDNRALFKEAEAYPPLNYSKKGSTIDLSFWRAPERLFDEPDELTAWARAAVAAAGRVAAKRQRAAPKRRARR
jgi:TfoX/Sxy family transcriptional regulator of competence genes